MAAIARTVLLPAAARHVTMLRDAQLNDLATETAELIDLFTDALGELEQRNLAENQPHDDVLKHARYMHGRVLPAMEAVRVAADALELSVGAVVLKSKLTSGSIGKLKKAVPR